MYNSYDLLKCIYSRKVEIYRYCEISVRQKANENESIGSNGHKRQLKYHLYFHKFICCSIAINKLIPECHPNFKLINHAEDSSGMKQFCRTQ